VLRRHKCVEKEDVVYACVGDKPVGQATLSCASHKPRFYVLLISHALIDSSSVCKNQLFNSISKK
jgi:hypothetical protein